MIITTANLPAECSMNYKRPRSPYGKINFKQRRQANT